MTVAGAKETGITRVAVIGAGSMGGGIAAQFANAGIAVDLLDMAGPAGNRNGPAEAGMARQLGVGGFMAPAAAKNMRCGNVEDHLDRLAEADWIVEAVIERIEVKRDLFTRIEKVRRPGTIISSNTSTLPHARIIEGMPEAFARDFVITHFFNPPRMMQLLEIVTGPGTDPAVDRRVHDGARVLLGKTVVDCRDTPGFIANRIGCFWLAMAAVEARRRGLDVELADAVNAALGVPRTGVFGLLDLIGIDLVPNVWGSLIAALPADDAFQDFDLPGDDLIQALIASGRIGRKAGAGFYRKAADGSREALDLASGEYRAQKPVTGLPGDGRDLAALLADEGPAGQYARVVLAHVVAYAATHAPDLANDVAEIDTAVVLGYSWKEGPLKLADRAGAAQVSQWLQAMGQPVPGLLVPAQQGGFYGDGDRLATDGRRVAAGAAAPLASAPVLAGNKAASLHDIGDGVACLRLHTKMNSFHPDVFDVLEETLSRAGRDFGALVIGNEDPRTFSVGADLAFFLSMIDKGGVAALDSYVARGQSLFLGLRRAPVPVVAAAHGFALGGGCEFLLHADAVVAHSELNAGLPEVKVGLVPGWGGCTTLLMRGARGAAGPLQGARSAMEVIFAGNISGSALEARGMGLLRDSDRIVMYRGDLLRVAKEQALHMVPGYAPPAPAEIRVAGPSGRAGLLAPWSQEQHAGRITENDFAIAEVLASVLTGGAAGDSRTVLSEEALMAEERRALATLVNRPETRARMEHMLRTGKPLRN